MELVEKCKQAIKDNDLEKAGKYWNQIFEKYCPSAEIVKADSKKANYLREKSYREEGLIWDFGIIEF